MKTLLIILLSAIVFAFIFAFNYNAGRINKKYDEDVENELKNIKNP